MELTVEQQLRHKAIDGDNQRLQELIANGASVNQVNEQHKNGPIHLACFYGHEAVVLQLLQKGTQCSKSNKNGQTPLQLASMRGHLGIVKMLLEYKCTIDSKAMLTGMTALHYASKSGHAEICQTLLDNGATEEMVDQIGKNAEFYAANYETEQVFKKNIKKSMKKVKENIKKEEIMTEEENEEENRDNREKKKKNWKKIKDHKFEWSEEYKARQKQTVFDRLMGGGKRT